MEPPVPPPDHEPPQDIDSEHDEKLDDTDVQPTCKEISKLKHQYKLSVDGHSRKFAFKTFGSSALALMACEEFHKKVRKMLAEFDSYHRKPQNRKEILSSVGCDEKFMLPKTSITSQRDAILRRLFSGSVMFVEQAVLDIVIKSLTGELDIQGASMKTTPKGFLASFKGENHIIEKTFASVLEGFDWLKSLVIADKAWVMSETKEYSTVPHIVHSASSVWIQYSTVYCMHKFSLQYCIVLHVVSKWLTVWYSAVQRFVFEIRIG